MNKYALFGIFMLLIVGAIWGVGSLSVIGEGVKETCVINSTTKSCTMELTLPEFRSVENYNLDLEFSSVPGAYGNEIQVTPIAGLGPLIEEGDMDESSSLQELETHYTYLYRLPSNWNLDNIYSVKLDASSNGWIQDTSTQYGDIDLSMTAGIIDYPYTSNSVLKCGESYDAETCIVRHYDRDYSRSPNEWRHYYYNIVDFAPNNYEIYEDMDSNDNVVEANPGVKYSGTFGTIGSFILDDKVNEYGITDASSELAMVIRMSMDEREKGYVSGGMTVPPTVYLTYAQEYRPTNTMIQIGDIDVQQITGQPDNVTTLDLATAINTYCETRAVGDKCTVPITFRSSEIGIIKATGESGQLRATSQVSGRSGGNLLTGFAVGEFAGNSFDFNDHPIQAYTTVGLIFVILMAGIVFVPWGGKKK